MLETYLANNPNWVATTTGAGAPDNILPPGEGIFVHNLAGQADFMIMQFGEVRTNQLAVRLNDSWTLPDSDESNNGTFEKTWDIASATQAIVGQIDDNQGGGELIQPGQNFENSDLQFATIPEPSSAVLILLVSLPLL